MLTLSLSSQVRCRRARLSLFLSLPLSPPLRLAHFLSFCFDVLQGVETVISVPRDFTLTNAALGEDLADASGRSVLKLTHEVIPAKRFQDGGYISGEESEEEDEEEEDDDVEMTTIVVTSLTAGKVSSQPQRGGRRFEISRARELILVCFLASFFL